MITDRYFYAKNNDKWVVWDRGAKNHQHLVAEYARSAKGEAAAAAHAADLNRQVRDGGSPPTKGVRR
jgi:hypothetical protein